MRDALMERLTMTASEYTTTGVSVTVNNEHFERILPSAVQGFWRDPYFFCAWRVLQSLFIVEEQWTVDLEKLKPLWFLLTLAKRQSRFAAEIFYAVKSQSKQPNAFGNMVFGEICRTPQIQAELARL
jgi:siroheme synthase (precorrin-2 oxidase/ferrochelatase)